MPFAGADPLLARKALRSRKNAIGHRDKRPVLGLACCDTVNALISAALAFRDTDPRFQR
jgi:hypothetical protein